MGSADTMVRRQTKRTRPASRADGRGGRWRVSRRFPGTWNGRRAIARFFSSFLAATAKQQASCWAIDGVGRRWSRPAADAVHLTQMGQRAHGAADPVGATAMNCVIARNGNGPHRAHPAQHHQGRLERFPLGQPLVMMKTANHLMVMGERGRVLHLQRRRWSSVVGDAAALGRRVQAAQHPRHHRKCHGVDGERANQRRRHPAEESLEPFVPIRLRDTIANPLIDPVSS